MKKDNKFSKKIDKSISLEMDVRMLGGRSCHITASGYSAEEVTSAMREAMKMLPPIGEQEIAMIEANPSLSGFQKKRLTRETRRILREARKWNI